MAKSGTSRPGRRDKPYRVSDHRGTKWTPDEEQLLVQRYKAGHKPAVLAELHGRSVGAIRSRVRKLGIQ